MWLWMLFTCCPVERIKLMQLMVLILYLTFSLESKGFQLNYDKIKNQNLASSTAIEIKLKKDYITKSLEFKVEYSFQGGAHRPAAGYRKSGISRSFTSLEVFRRTKPPGGFIVRGWANQSLN